MSFLKDKSGDFLYYILPWTTSAEIILGVAKAWSTAAYSSGL